VEETGISGAIVKKQTLIPGFLGGWYS